MKNMDLSHRKVKESFRVTDAEGRPIVGKKISVKQTNHSFLFGCGAFHFMHGNGRKLEEDI